MKFNTLIFIFQSYYFNLLSFSKLYSDVKILSENNTADKLKDGITNIGPTLRSYLRILKLARKPSRKEFMTIAKVAAIGILAIGILGFIFYVAMDVVPQYFIPVRT
jgi:protein translocase SEC61 complex gamma subunit, archaeal and eukaryotic